MLSGMDPRIRGAGGTERDTPVRPAHQHEHNLSLVTRLAARSGPVSRARLAQHSGLTKSTVTQLVAELLEAGLLRELGTGRSTGPGRPANLLVLNSQGPAGIGLQVEADHVAGCLVDLTGRVRERAIRRADDVLGSTQRAIRVAEPVLRRLLQAAISTDSVVAGLVVGLPATLRDHIGETRLLLEDRLTVLGAGSIPVTVEDAAALAVRAEAAGDDAGTLVYVGGEDGVEAGILVGGVVHSGARGAAGEFGHLRVTGAEDRCSCGATGCLDTVASRSAMQRAAGLTVALSTRLAGGEGPLPELVRAGEPRAAAAARRAAEGIGEVLAGAVAALDPAAVVLGGHYAPLGQPFADAARGALLSRCPGADPVVLRPSRLPPDTVARAAAAAVVRRLVDSPARWLEQA